jgi:hypothetical protein
MAKQQLRPEDRVFSGVFPTGISYADRTVEVGGDYKRLAFLPFSTLELEWHAKRVPADVRAYIVRDAAKIQARRGGDYRVSTAGQTVRLGGDMGGRAGGAGRGLQSDDLKATISLDGRVIAARSSRGWTPTGAATADVARALHQAIFSSPDDVSAGDLRRGISTILDDREGERGSPSKAEIERDVRRITE